MTEGIRTGNLLTEGALLHYEIRGEGEPLLLLHGMGGHGDDWIHAGRDAFEKEYSLIIPDARGHGRSSNSTGSLRHDQMAADVLALLDRLDIWRCRAIGMSMGANTLLHLATAHPGRVASMILVSATMTFPEQARAIMRQSTATRPPDEEWVRMRKIHVRGDDQIMAIWQAQHDMADSHDDMAFAPADLRQITAKTLIVYGDRDPLYPVETAVNMYRSIPGSALWVVPGGGHGPIYGDHAGQFAQTALEFLG